MGLGLVIGGQPPTTLPVSEVHVSYFLDAAAVMPTAGPCIKADRLPNLNPAPNGS